MANNTEKKTPAVDIRVKALTIACAVLVLAVIVVSAFAYEWHSTMVELKDANMDLRAIADTSTLESMSYEIGNLTAERNMLQEENTNLRKTVAKYEEILTENGLLPE